jgi:hypothetical protein
MSAAPMAIESMLAKSQAERQGLACSISFELFNKTICEPCWYCGGHAEKFRGIDRKDNKMGYEPGNVIACCSTCNYIKGRDSWRSSPHPLPDLPAFAQNFLPQSGIARRTRPRARRKTSKGSFGGGTGSLFAARPQLSLRGAGSRKLWWRYWLPVHRHAWGSAINGACVADVAFPPRVWWRVG